MRLPKASDIVQEVLWYDGPYGWYVTTRDRNGKERDYEASVQCCDPASLDQSKCYLCESRVSGPGRVVSAIRGEA